MDSSWVTELAARFPIIGPTKQPDSIQIYILLQTKPSNYSLTPLFFEVF
jgi:hypothetical protein